MSASRSKLMSSCKLLKRTNDHLRPVLGFFMCRHTEISASGNASWSSMPELRALCREVAVELDLDRSSQSGSMLYGQA